MGDTITSVDKFRKGWAGGLPETPCGSGSKIQNTEAQREWIPEIVEKYGIKTVADIGAGDLNWVPKMNWDVDYKPYDLVPRHDSVKEFDLVREVPPKVDMILCLWVLNHLPYADCLSAIKNIKASGSKYLMMTDRPVWHHEQPPEIHMPFIEELVVTGKGDRILLIDLC